MTSRFLDSFFFTKEKAESLKQVRIIKTNLIHVHGLPKNLVSKDLLKSPEYFGQYGKIIKIIITQKKNPDNNRKTYSAYITYSNKREASLAILCVDSLMIKGKIIRAFFGTNKYCNYFLNNNRCPNSAKCIFLHKLETNRDIIIDSKTVFAYDEHLQLTKKIIRFNKLEIRNLIRNTKKTEKNIFPFIDYIFLNEEEKENYFESEDISYVRSNNNEQNSLALNNSNDNFKNNLESNNTNIAFISVNNYIKKHINIISNYPCIKNLNMFQNPINLHSIIANSIKNILLVQSHFNNINKTSLKKMEYEYFKNNLIQKGIDVNNLLKGCLDCLNEVIM